MEIIIRNFRIINNSCFWVGREWSEIGEGFIGIVNNFFKFKIVGDLVWLGIKFLFYNNFVVIFILLKKKTYFREIKRFI